MHLTGLSRVTLWRLEAAGKFPKRCKLSQNSVAWREEEVSQWLETRPLADPRGSVGAVSIPRRDV